MYSECLTCILLRLIYGFKSLLVYTYTSFFSVSMFQPSWAHASESVVNTSAAIFQAIFSGQFYCIKIVVFWLQFYLELHPRVQLTKNSIGSDNGLAPNRWQAIIWSDDGLCYWRTNASPGLDKLITVLFNHTIRTNTWMLTVIPSKWY